MSETIVQSASKERKLSAGGIPSETDTLTDNLGWRGQSKRALLEPLSLCITKSPPSEKGQQKAQTVGETDFTKVGQPDKQVNNITNKPQREEGDQ